MVDTSSTTCDNHQAVLCADFVVVVARPISQKSLMRKNKETFAVYSARIIVYEK